MTLAELVKIITWKFVCVATVQFKLFRNISSSELVYLLWLHLNGQDLLFSHFCIIIIIIQMSMKDLCSDLDSSLQACIPSFMFSKHFIRKAIPGTLGTNTGTHPGWHILHVPHHWLDYFPITVCPKVFYYDTDILSTPATRKNKVLL